MASHCSSAVPTALLALLLLLLLFLLFLLLLMSMRATLLPLPRPPAQQQQQQQQQDAAEPLLTRNRSLHRTHCGRGCPPLPLSLLLRLSLPH